MATQTLTALFDRYKDAAETVRRLEAAGVPHGDISLVSNDASHSQYYGAIPGDADPMPDGHVTATGTGASLGTLLGGGAGLLAGLGLLAIPGLGPVVAVGWLASTLVGAGVGAAAGGLVGSLTDIGVNEADAHAYAEGINRGGTLLTVRAEPDLAARIGEILDHDEAVSMPDRESRWRESGWEGRYVGKSAVTGAPVFTDPTMLSPGLPVGDVSRSAEAPSLGSVTPDNSLDLHSGPAGTPLPIIPAPDQPVGRASERRDRVRIYDQP
jgi:hypothetical protein